MRDRRLPETAATWCGTPASAYEQMGHRVDHRIGVEAVVPIEIRQVAGLTEPVDAERGDAPSIDAAQPRQRTR